RRLIRMALPWPSNNITWVLVTVRLLISQRAQKKNTHTGTESWNSMKKSILLWLKVTLIVIPSAYAQDAELWQSLKSRYPDEPAVFIERSEELSLSVEGDSLRIVNDVKEDMMHLKEQTEAYSGRKVYGSHFSHVADIKAKTLVWDKNRYREIGVSDFKKNSDRDRGIFYDDSYYYTFDFPSVAS